MPEIGTSGSMSVDGKRSVAAWPKLPRPSSTLPLPRGVGRGVPSWPQQRHRAAFEALGEVSLGEYSWKYPDLIRRGYPEISTPSAPAGPGLFLWPLGHAMTFRILSICGRLLMQKYGFIWQNQP